MADLPPLPNPLTPLAWLPPDIAVQLEASRYLYITTFGAWIWDFLMSLPEEFRMLRKFRLGRTDVVYVLARLASIGFITTSVVFQTATVEDCHALAKAIGWFGAMALPLNCLLFFFRIRALFNQNQLVVVFFGLLWLATFTSITAPFGVDGTHIGTTKYCVNSDVKSFSSAGIVVVAVHDTLVFLAITAKLSTYSMADTWSDRIKSILSGDGLGAVSRALLQTGQLYYLATVGMNIVTMSLILTPSVPPILRAMFAIPNVALQNAMACRVYRLLKLGVIREDDITHLPSAILSDNRIRFANSNSRYSSGMSRTNGSGGLDSVTKPQKAVIVAVEVERDVSTRRDSLSLKDRQNWGPADFA